jgi:ATP-dependent helicase YprA (DUF1998 family)
MAMTPALSRGLDPIGSFESLRGAFFRYYDTPFGLADKAMQEERRRLLDRDGGIYRRPLLELRPQYRTAGRTLAESVAAAGAPSELAAFGSAGLIPGGMQLYTHQEDALRLGMVPGRNVVITAGTGSGKTESFLLPVLASLLEESRGWSGGPAGPSRWWPGDGAFAAQRSGETGRPPAVRALVLYPMNALVDDQLTRLRRALDSDDARAWLDQHRRGHRFYFGRYTGSTPVTGGPDDGRAVSELRRYLQATEARGERARAQSPETGYFVPRLDGAEMRSRWDMAAAPPDVLITNYSMLNVMLLRDRDAHFFTRTRDWLHAHPSHRFTLVVDELHTYRGTAGTEVALLIRNLKHRLGLDDAPHKLRVLAASASLDAARDRLYCKNSSGSRRTVSSSWRARTPGRRQTRGTSPKQRPAWPPPTAAAPASWTLQMKPALRKPSGAPSTPHRTAHRPFSPRRRARHSSGAYCSPRQHRRTPPMR